jgi:hypothetical protein
MCIPKDTMQAKAVLRRPGIFLENFFLFLFLLNNLFSVYIALLFQNARPHPAPENVLFFFFQSY